MEPTQQLYVCFDRVSESVIGQVMQFPHDAPAVRMFADALASDGFLAKHPQDFELRCIGSVGMTSCELVSLSSPRLVLSGETWAQAQASSTGEQQ